VVDFNDKASDIKLLKNLGDNFQDFSIRNHKRISTSNIKITLIELSESSLCHLRVVSSIDFCNVVSFNLSQIFLGYVPCERYCQVVSER